VQKEQLGAESREDREVEILRIVADLAASGITLKLTWRVTEVVSPLGPGAAGSGHSVLPEGPAALTRHGSGRHPRQIDPASQKAVRPAMMAPVAD
jgi:hypothetical protein